MIQICRKEKEKVYQAIRTGNIDAAELSFPNLIDYPSYNEKIWTFETFGFRPGGKTQGQSSYSFGYSSLSCRCC